MRCCSVHRNDTKDAPRVSVNRRAAAHCCDSDGLPRQQLTGTDIREKVAAGFAE